MELTVKITGEHIHKGIKGTNDRCPIAIALNEQHPRKGVWFVDCDRAETIAGNDFEAYELPKKARIFIQEFDEEPIMVKPFTFELTEKYCPDE